jgi:hypothetical protein
LFCFVLMLLNIRTRLRCFMHVDGLFFSENNLSTCMKQPGLVNSLLLQVILKIINLRQTKEPVCKDAFRPPAQLFLSLMFLISV